MCCKSFWKVVVPFAIALTLGVFITIFFQKINYRNEIQIVPRYANKVHPATCRTGIGGGGGREIETTFRTETNAVQIISKPRPNYTDEARQNQIHGKMTLQVTFLASGQIGSVSAVSSLPDGLTEQAIIAAQKIKFQPATKDGKPITVTKLIEYSFTIY